MIEIAVGVLLSMIAQALIAGIAWGKFSNKIETMPHVIASDLKLYVQQELSNYHDTHILPEFKDLREKIAK